MLNNKLYCLINMKKKLMFLKLDICLALCPQTSFKHYIEIIYLTLFPETNNLLICFFF